MLYIIVPVHNRLERTIQFVKSLERQEFASYQLVIVDDGSQDETAEYLTDYFPETIVLKGDGNLFWGGAINMGIDFVKRHAGVDDYIAFANNDVVLEAKTIPELISAASKENKLGIFHSLVIDQISGKCFSSGSKLISWPFFLTRHPFRGTIPALDAENAKPERINLATARFILFKTSVLTLLDRIDTKNFIHYLGDCDFSMRAEKHKINTYIIPTSHCYIDNSSTGENAGNLKSFRQFINSLGSIRSSNNLKLRFRFGRIHCPGIFYPAYCISVTLKVFISNLLIRKINN